MRLLKHNQKGITHLLAPIAFIVIFAAIGAAFLLRSHAAAAKEPLLGSVYLNGKPQRNAQVTLTQKYVNGYSRDYTNKVGAYGFYFVTIGKKYTVRASKGINGIRYCASKTFTAQDNGRSFVGQDLSLSRSAC